MAKTIWRQSREATHPRGNQLGCAALQGVVFHRVVVVVMVAARGAGSTGAGSRLGSGVRKGLASQENSKWRAVVTAWAYNQHVRRT